MDEYESLRHSKWECKYHVVFIPKCGRKVLYGNLRRHLGEVFRKLAEQKECQIEEGHLQVDHVHRMITIPPKYSVSSVVGFIKGKSAIHLARVYGEQKQTGLSPAVGAGKAAADRPSGSGMLGDQPAGTRSSNRSSRTSKVLLQ